MSTLTKEWLQQTIAELEEERDAVPGVVNEDAANALAAMKLALASLESGGEACEACGGNGSVDIDHGEMGIEHIECPKFYTSQPAPVSVPEWTNEQCLEFLSIAFRHAEIKGDLELDDIRLGVKMVNGSRAAMLQGAEPVMTAYKLPFEQWLSQQTGTIDVECGCVMTEVFFHWLRVAYEAGNSPVIPDGWVLVPVEPTMSQEFAGYRTLTDTGKMSRLMKTRLSNIYRAMIAAAQQQEVKP
ncbi:hypothetical protein [Enterobacter hormaechei]|uniref:hypothetical protein n=1 Tax=Enterobacter hormaechei TaxID=158836 RepID=UPI0020214C0E|nr:hypothetical protein [Enterobacter hormaechei]MCL8080623.1 hypothetical protein [Enterobacter hormaechei]MCM6983433.1 hypothetical protein [Enterobacter hormaechei]MCM7053513.1 hypothetical protein [Enterobacter hormaechei]